MAQAGLFPPARQVGLMYVPRGDGLAFPLLYLIPWSMMPDVIELDELTTGQRREGFLWLGLLQKFGLALGLFLGIALEWSGFKETIAGKRYQNNRLQR